LRDEWLKPHQTDYDEHYQVYGRKVGGSLPARRTVNNGVTLGWRGDTEVADTTADAAARDVD
jgi:hypothetical protein